MLHRLSPGNRRTKKSKRVARGTGSGRGKTAGRGHKGQKSRSGSSASPGFEGGQMSLLRRVPKRGFKNIFGKFFSIVNLSQLNVFEDGAIVDPEKLRLSGIIKKKKGFVKILSVGELEKKITIKAHKFSKAAETKIKASGSKIEVLEL